MTAGLRRWQALFTAVLLVPLLGGCRDSISLGQSLLEQGMEQVTGTEADQRLFSSLSAFNYEGMREAVEDGADVNTLKAAWPVGTDSPLRWLLTGEGEIGYDLYGNCTNVDFITYLLEQGADPNETDETGRTLAMLCCGADGRGYMAADQFLAQLLSHGADVTRTDQAGMTALDYAVQRGGPDAVSLLMEYGAVPTQQTLTLAFTAPRTDFFLSHRAAVAKTMLAAYPSEVRAEGFSPLLIDAAQSSCGAVTAGAANCPAEDLAMLAQLAVAYCDLESVLAVQAAGFSFTTWKDGETSDDGWRYVELALQNGQADTALWLLEETGYSEADGLIYAAQQGLADMTAFFLERGALQDAMPQSEDGRPWEIFDNLLAESVGNPDVLRLLSEAGYPTNALSLAQALNQAIVADAMDSIRYLCETAGADPSYLPEGIDSAMETACLHGNLSIVTYLQNHGASLDAEGGYLRAAVIKHHTQVEEYLLRQGVPPDSRAHYEDGSESQTPLTEAVRDGRLELVQLLLAWGADPNGVPMEAAEQGQSRRIVQFLIDAGAEAAP
ncbi:ankyrin repeat domain-containing protein [Pseudoflavonifractor phocaeensis]|uniref:ankyrin repeat domain-containing protein n=1 Tax=Pseudoflavonifractor phocaeensis TaxID=1870988 RepID=UPI00195BF83E|nr:ankyrin repeat domain-containing protein [Pseudoflavonifractor phocaeensis]MBM6939367.1 ankyrin repeat domain-containing protein [Pseudoflavonifractor phocaeensis]